MLLGVVFIVHVIGFATINWAKVEINTGRTVVMFSGLWQHCGCYSHYCSCTKQANDQGWFKAVRITESIGLVGLLICGIVTLVLLCSQPKRGLRIFNFFILGISSLSIILGVILFESDRKGVFDLYGSINYFDSNTRLSLGYSFYMSTIAGGLGMLVCLPLFVADSRSKQLGQSQRAAQYSNQGQMVLSSRGFANPNAQPQADYFQNNLAPENMQPYPVFYSQGNLGHSIQGYMAPPYAREPSPYTEKPTAST